jgi:hypothetical protein
MSNEKCINKDCKYNTDSVEDGCWYHVSIELCKDKIIENQHSSSSPSSISRRLQINHTKWSKVLQGLDKKVLRELCFECEIPIDKKNNREYMANKIAQKIDVNNRMWLELNIDKFG